MSHTKQKSIVVCALLLLISICLISCTSDSVALDPNYTDPNNSQIIRIESADDFFSIKNGFVHFGKETCASCKVFFPVLSEASSLENLTVYYFDTGYFRENSLLSESELQEIFSDYQVLSVPIVIKISDGQTVDTYYPKFNEQRNNTEEIQESIRNFLLQNEENRVQ